MLLNKPRVWLERSMESITFGFFFSGNIMEKLLAVLFTLAFAISASSLHGKLKDCRTFLGWDGDQNEALEMTALKLFPSFLCCWEGKIKSGRKLEIYPKNYLPSHSIFNKPKKNNSISNKNKATNIYNISSSQRVSATSRAWYICSHLILQMAGRACAQDRATPVFSGL